MNPRARTTRDKVTGKAQISAMRAVVQHRYGPPEVLSVEQVPAPFAGDDEVLVSVRAAALNVADDIIMRGIPYFVRLLSGLRRPRHGVRGVDVAGVVVSAGPAVTRVRPGDAVFGSTAGVFEGGAFAEYVVMPEAKTAPKPAGLTFEQAAAIPVAGVTALRALRDAAGVHPGQRVLINGGRSPGTGLTCPMPTHPAAGLGESAGSPGPACSGWLCRSGSAPATVCPHVPTLSPSPG